MPQASDYKRGMLLVGGVNPALVIAGLGPSGAVVYGGRVSPKPKTSLAEIEARLAAAQQRLDEIVAAANQDRALKDKLAAAQRRLDAIVAAVSRDKRQ
jgi:hypothetical protein